MIDLKDDILNALKNDSELSSLVASRVYWIRPAGNPAFPYITFFEVANSENSSADDEEYSDLIEFQVDIWSKASFSQVYKATQRVMRGLGFTHVSLPDQFEEDTGIFHKAIQFTIQKEEE